MRAAPSRGATSPASIARQIARTSSRVSALTRFSVALPLSRPKRERDTRGSRPDVLALGIWSALPEPPFSDDPPMSDELATACVALLCAQGVRLAEGLSSEELAGIERRFDFAFSQDHAALLTLAVPVGDRWADWRGPAEELRPLMAWPIDGLLFDVENNAFWARSWGPRPDVDAQAIDEARRHLLSWPKLVPLFSHRYMPAAPAPSRAPVFSVYQADVIYYGADLHDYLLREFGGRRGAVEGVTHPVEPWSNLAMGCDDSDL
jgi:hypothetical protein